MMVRPSKKKTPNSPADAINGEGAPKLSKLDCIAGLVGRADGATLAELISATGWQQHSVRGALAGALRKRKLNITSQKLDGVRRYRIGGQA